MTLKRLDWWCWFRKWKWYDEKRSQLILFPTSKAIGSCWIEFSYIALGCVLQHTSSILRFPSTLNIYSLTANFLCVLTYTDRALYTILLFFLHGVFHWLYNAVEYRVRLGLLPVVLCIYYTLYMSIGPPKKEQCQLQPANSEEEEKAMTTFLTLFVVARLCWNPFATYTTVKK